MLPLYICLLTSLLWEIFSASKSTMRVESKPDEVSVKRTRKDDGFA
jgi:hypothetical protein